MFQNDSPPNRNQRESIKARPKRTLNTPTVTDMDSSELEKSICVIGSGTAGLVSAQVLVQDGFKNVEVITRDRSPGGTWAEERMYPELRINK